MYQALYRKWRPQTFSDVVGQPAITDTIKAQVESGRLSHAYLFAGSRGTGKTSCAKILAKAVNCEHPVHGDPCNACPACLGITSGAVMDVVEIDAASNNGVDGVRELRDEAVYSPAAVKKRVYIIDEVHMFSNSAFNALLKILEEPPEHVLFILATTELHKVPATILSRCQRFTFQRIAAPDIRDRILFIARSEQIEVEPDAADFIAQLADGGMRDALSIFDQCASYGHAHITRATVEDVIGLAGTSAICALTDAIAAGDSASALSQLEALYTGGRDLVSVLSELSGYLRDLLVEKAAPGSKLRRMSAVLDAATCKRHLAAFSEARFIAMLTTISEALAAIGASPNKRIDAELCMVKLCAGDIKNGESALLQRIEAIERVLKSGAVPAAQNRQPSTAQPVGNPVDNVDNPAPATKKDENLTKADCPPDADKRAPAEEKPRPAAAAAADAAGVWAAVLDAARLELSPGILPLLRTFTARRDGAQLLLVPDNPLAKNILNHKESLAALTRAAQTVCGQPMVLRVVERAPEAAGENHEFKSLCNQLKDVPNVTILP